MDVLACRRRTGTVRVREVSPEQSIGRIAEAAA